jgi:hypothetical protein
VTAEAVARGPAAGRRPDPARIASGFSSGPTRGAYLDWIAFHLSKLGQRIARAVVRRPKVRPHPRLLRTAVEETVGAFPDPACIETGSLRDPNEGTDSTRVIAATLGERGRLYTFELDPKHLAVCREVCREFADRIEYVEGDAKVNLRQWRERGTLRQVHFAFLDSADDPEQIWEEFRAIEDLFVPGSVLVVDDVVPPAVKGRRIKPYLHRDPAWETRLVYAGKGLLVAVRRSAGAA